MKYKYLLLVCTIGSLVVFIGKGFQHSQKKTTPSSYPVTEQKPFVIIIPSYNNEKYIEKNLRSVFSQNYSNYRVIYIDDHSRDNTLLLAQSLFKELDKKGCASLIHNPTNYGALANIYNAVHSCHDEEIVVLLDGDDFLAHEQVLTILNQTYANPNIWMTYGNYLDYPSYQQNPQICKKIANKIIENRSFRKKPWSATHLRTFYTSIFKEINIADLFYRGRFYPMGWDLAIMIPMLEMSGPHSAFIEDVLYLYNRENPISDHKIHLEFQNDCSKHIRARSCYPLLSCLPNHDYPKQTADLLIFSEDRPMQLYALLESIQSFVFGLRKTIVVYETSSSEMESQYLDLKMNFPNIQFFKMEENGKSLIQSIAFNSPSSPSKHIILAQDTLLVTDIIDFTKAIHALDLSRAYALFPTHHGGLEFSAELMRHQPLPPAIPLRGLANGEPPFAWQFSEGIDDWNSPNPFSFALFRKEDLKKTFKNLTFDSLENIIQTWSLQIPENGIGLYYPKAKCIYLNISPTISKQDLMEKFDEGLKIDLTKMSQVKSPSQEITSHLTFIPRDY